MVVSRTEGRIRWNNAQPHSPAHTMSPQPVEAALSQEGTCGSRYCVQLRIDTTWGGNSKAEWLRLWAWVQSLFLPLTSWRGQVSWLLCASVSSSARWDNNSAYLIELFWQFNEFTTERTQNSALHAQSRCYWVQACSAHCTTGQWISEMRSWVRNMTLFGKPGYQEDGRLMSQNNHLRGSGCQPPL